MKGDYALKGEMRGYVQMLYEAMTYPHYTIYIMEEERFATENEKKELFFYIASKVFSEDALKVAYEFSLYPPIRSEHEADAKASDKKDGE